MDEEIHPFFHPAMKHLTFSVLLAFLCALFLGGCDLAQPQNKGQEQPVVSNEPPPPPVEVQPAQVTPPQNGNSTVTVTAAPGRMTGKGNYASADGEKAMGIIPVPLTAMFRTQERLVLLQITDAMNKYKAIHEKGPASHAEFMEQIIRANNIKLPPLPSNQEFMYDPADGELKIRKPAQ